MNNGLIIFIGNQSENLILSNGINISPGYSTKISLEKLTISKKPHPYSYCIANLNTVDSYDSVTYKKILKQKQNQQYNYMSCYLLCMQKQIGDKCHCQIEYLSLIYYDNLRFCYLNESLREIDNQCFIESLRLILNNSKPYLNDCDCPIECDHDFYKYSISFLEFPTRYYLPYLIESKLIKTIFNQSLNDSLESFELLRKNVARVEINYQDMMQTFISEYPKMQSTDLISSLGGILGLFLGLNFLSLIEIFDFSIQILSVFIKKFKISSNSTKK
jgi:hypothetical protein